MTSIVVLTYNQLEDCTKACLESIYKYTNIKDFELIVVDNNSQDGTGEYLKSIEHKYPNIKIILNEENKGYSGGNNDGIKASKGDVVILLNNDTLVSENWLENLLKPFDKDKKIGLVGPISNSVGNEQRVNIDGLNEKNYIEKSKEYTTLNKDVVCETQRLGFFCVAIKRELIDKIGLLDEKFGIGMFEDDDYCMRSIKAGYKNVFVEDSFVYHKGSVSFKKLTTEAYQEIFQKNKAYFLEKHGVEWSLSDIAFSYWNKFNDNLQEFSKNKNEASIDRITKRFDNFKHLLYQIREIEIKKSNITNSVHSSIVTNTKWQIRLNNLKNELIFSSLSDKKRYLKRIYSRFFGTPEEMFSFKKLKIQEIKVLAKSKKIIVFPPTIDYSYMKQRPQHFADEFAKKDYFVIYATLNHKTDKVDYFQQINENLILINESLLYYLSHAFFREDVIFYCMWPNNNRYAKIIQHAYLIYDYMDELDLLESNHEELIHQHNVLLEKANLITVSAQKLYDSIDENYREKILLLPNAVDEEFLTSIETTKTIPNEIKLIRNNYKRIIGYYGAIAPWVDFELIEYLLKQNKSDFYLFIGPVFDTSEKVAYLLNNYENILFIKEMPRENIISYLKIFDKCIIPFIKNNITDSVSPVKVYEYLAAGKDVVSTNILECEKIEYIDVASNKEEFSKNLQLSSKQKKSIIKDYVLENLWSKRVEKILEFMERKK